MHGFIYKSGVICCGYLCCVHFDFRQPLLLAFYYGCCLFFVNMKFCLYAHASVQPCVCVRACECVCVALCACYFCLLANLEDFIYSQGLFYFCVCICVCYLHDHKSYLGEKQKWCLKILIFAIEWCHCESCSPWPWPAFPRSNMSNDNIWLMVGASAKLGNTAVIDFDILPFNGAIMKVTLTNFSRFNISDVDGEWNGDS